MNRIDEVRLGILAPATVAPPSPVPDDPRVVRALEASSAAHKAGQMPDRHEFQARYPEVAAAMLCPC